METSSLMAFTLLATVVAGVYLYLRSIFSYWKDHSIPSVGATEFFRGIKDLLFGNRTVYELQMDTYNSLNGHKYGGFYDIRRPTLMIRDPEMIERILIKDFGNFMNRVESLPSNQELDIVTLNLINANGELWRNLRYKMTPTFSSGKLKGMFEQINRCSDDVIQFIDSEGANGDIQLDAKLAAKRFTMNVIATCAFGIEFQYEDKGRDKFLEMVARLVTPSFGRILMLLFQSLSPTLAMKFGMKPLDTESSNYFVGLVDEAIRFRTETNTRRNDFLQLLLDLKKNEENCVDARCEGAADREPEDAIINQIHHVSEQNQKSVEQSKFFTLQSITAQSILFLTAGAEGASDLIKFFMFAVAAHPEIQRKLQKEVDQVLRKHGQWSYEMLKDMTYIDQVLQETMRMYPAPINLMRKCTKPFQLPDSDVVIQPGTPITIPTYSLHYDPQYYPDPHKFDPDRFIDTNYKPNGHFLPFGDGPRICIAMRFAILEMKICLARITAEYNITLGSKTQVPLQFEKRGLIMIPKGGIWLKFDKREVHC